MKSQFRSFAVLPLDSVYIVQVILFANGFKEYKLLARKLVQLQELCAEQLSHAEHYDFGIRTTKSIVSLAKILKRQGDTLSETEVIVKAALQVNLPKLIAEDLILFKETCTQVFPSANVSHSHSSMVIKTFVRDCFVKHDLTPTPQLIEKTLQMYGMLAIKNGIIIVGNAMCGKTTIWKMLAEALRDMKSSPDAAETEYDVVYRIINPKSISVDQLFGNTDPEAREWSDSAVEKVYREMVSVTAAQCRGWMVFDGIVDPTWTECLHTLLDDNRKLCLASGEMIEKTELMAILFETDNLQFASPGTVARCGVVYVDQSKEQWRSVHSSFVQVLQRFGLIEIYMTLFETLVDWLVPATLEIVNDYRAVLQVPSSQHYKVRFIQIICC